MEVTKSLEGSRRIIDYYKGSRADPLHVIDTPSLIICVTLARSFDELNDVVCAPMSG